MLAQTSSHSTFAQIAEVPSATSHLAVDAPRKLANAIASFLGEHPRALLVAEGDRRPETLGIRPLPEYNSLEEAMKVSLQT